MVMSSLEKEIERVGTMYFVWMDRNNSDKNIDVFFSHDITGEECEKMLGYFTRAVKQIKEKRKRDGRAA